MTRRSRLWWSAALTATAAGVAYLLSLTGETLAFGYFSSGFCPGADLRWEVPDRVWPLVERVPLLWYNAAPLIVAAFGAHWLTTRLGRPRIGRVLARVTAVVTLLLYGHGLIAFGVDMAIDRQCLEMWGGVEGARFFLRNDVAPTIAALCVLVAARGPRLRTRRMVRSRWFRRGVAGATALGALAFLPAADLTPGPITTGGCESGTGAYLCGLRQDGRFTKVGDHLALAYGRQRCAAFRGEPTEAYAIAPICPPAADVLRRAQAADQAAWEAEEAAEQAVCDRARHRPRIRPVRVAHDRMLTDYGVMEAVETEDALDDDLLNRAQDDGLVAARRGHLLITTHSDYTNCLTGEAYDRRPPVETKGWDRVVELGYESPTGVLELVEAMSGEGLPNLAVRGAGRYRVRVHYREPDWEAWTPQHVLVMVYPGRSERVIDYR
ncbi:hypothetical protein ACBI99_37395 [Nonomuraea sp. ATR24]|uniref:hypothetical protein n=1 Tax=Nonomuraea sp. ATR24 TaxID=1676744 RepID=UPI0035BFF040